MDTAATTVLFVWQSVPVEMAAGEVLIFDAYYVDPDSGRSQRVGGKDIVTPVATTDYTEAILSCASRTTTRERSM